MSYDYWQNRLRGIAVAPQLDLPQCGFFRDRQDRPVAFYPQQVPIGSVPKADAPLICVLAVDGGFETLSLEQAKEVWNWCCVNAVEEIAWRAAAAGEPWPDNVPGIGHNRPADSPEMQRLVLIDAAETWLKINAEVSTKGVADQASKLIVELRRAFSDLEDEEKEKKKPYQNFIETVRDQYREMRKPIGDLGVRVKALLQPWLTAEAKRVEDARLQAIEENKAKQERGERAPAAVPRATAGRTGSKVGLKPSYSAEIADYDRAYRNACDEPEMRTALQVVANRFARGIKEGMTPGQMNATLLPGTKLLTEQKIV